MHVEDHPLEYGEFEGVIPEHQYGAGTVMLWDRGTWEPKGDPVAGYAKGHLKFELRRREAQRRLDAGAHARQQIRRQDRRQGVAADQGEGRVRAHRRTLHRRDRAQQRDDRAQPGRDRRRAHARLAIQTIREGERESRRHRRCQARREEESAARATERDAGRREGRQAAGDAVADAHDAGRERAVRTGLAARDQVRRLPDDVPDRKRQGAALFAQRQGLDGQFRRRRRGSRPDCRFAPRGSTAKWWCWTPTAAPAFRRCRMR